jgi:hypothetical protein
VEKERFANIGKHNDPLCIQNTIEVASEYLQDVFEAFRSNGLQVVRQARHHIIIDKLQN